MMYAQIDQIVPYESQYPMFGVNVLYQLQKHNVKSGFTWTNNPNR